MRWVASTPLASLDTETTDRNPFEARVVDIALALIVPGRDTDLRQALVNPGVEIPAEASAVHGISNERVQAEGKPSPEVLDLFVGDIAMALRAGFVLVIQNSSYDLTVLRCECERHGLPTIEDRLGGPVTPVLDPMVVDKQAIRYRKRVSPEQGARQLKTLAQVYGVPWDDDKAHGAAYDALIGARVVWRMAQWASRSHAELMAMRVGPFDPPKPMHRNDAAQFLALGAMSPAELHERQVGWYAEQAESLAEYWRRESTQRQADSTLDDPPGDPSLDADERRQVLRDEAMELLARADSVTTDWPLRVPAGVTP